MGTWGTAIFSDDLAADIRDDYRDYLGDGLSGAQATERLVAENLDSLKNPDEAAVFWFALAATQWKHGRLEERVKSRALHAIASGKDVRRWEDENPKEAKKRAAVLEKLKLQLESPPPPAKKVPKRFVSNCSWTKGQVIAYQLLSGRIALLVVVEFGTGRGGIYPICGLLDFVGSSIPTEVEILTLMLKKRQPDEPWHQSPHVFSISGSSQREYPHERVTALQTMLAPPALSRRLLCVYSWANFDEMLKLHYGLE
jgi:hypothetical protein